MFDNFEGPLYSADAETFKPQVRSGIIYNLQGTELQARIRGVLSRGYPQMDIMWTRSTILSSGREAAFLTTAKVISS
jgi:hypothetical protein